MGVPGNGNNLSHWTSPQVPSTGRKTSVDRTRELAQRNGKNQKSVSRLRSRRIGPPRPGRDALPGRDAVAAAR
ncbi:hypothetical protein Taro_001834 [Colocasia esculenta]|uniref:Uncharacterized protein n=1 Tax=Colocasia esculenta TaxID=4460 RepID=A0A843TET7_COLES|nr:hypothetical protein [Colocasia esculenta]